MSVVWNCHYHYAGATLHVIHVVVYNEYAMWCVNHYKVKVHAARPASHFSSINCNLSPSPSKNVVCNSDPVQWGTIEA